MLAVRSRQISWARLGTFIAGALLVIWAIQGGGPFAWIVTALAVVVFGMLVFFHDRIWRAEKYAAGRRDLAALGIARLDRDWKRLPVWEAPPERSGHPYASDLDLFGRGALTQLLGAPGSPHGRARVYEWLLDLPRPDETAARQVGVHELSQRLEYRDELTLHARGMNNVPGEDIADFVAWCEEIPSPEPWWLKAAIFVVPLALWAALGLRISGVSSGNAWLLPALAAVAITFGPWGTRARNTFGRVFRHDKIFHNLPDLVGHIAEHEYVAPRLEAIHLALHKSGDTPRIELDRLRRIEQMAEMRRSTFYLFIQLLTLWDLHVLRRLLAWQKRNGRNMRGWLDAAADMEALSALATLAHDNPDWNYATIKEDADRVVATALGHPLLQPSERVDNDVTVGPRGTFLLVTGSNMSGKSTLLRSIGTNLVLARVGAPVCARALALPLAVPCVSIRVQDSIASGVSFFMAELQRMRDIVALAERAPEEGWTCIYLLDEMLHGTNSAERRIAARTIIARLMRAGAIGAVSTHDLQLGAEQELRDHAARIHFSETVHKENGRPVMTFDYKLRPGDATSTNALVLLELMGLA